MEENKKSFTYTIHEVQRVQYQKTFDEKFAIEVKNVTLNEINVLQNQLSPEVMKVNFPYITPEYICLWNQFDFDLMKILLGFYFYDITEEEIIKLCEDKNYDYAAVRAAVKELISYIREDIYSSSYDENSGCKEILSTDMEDEYWALNEEEKEVNK